MSQTKVISFDAEGTLVTTDFSEAIWHEAIPALYAQKNRMELARAKKIVRREYDRVGDQRLEWYDIRYWLKYFQLGAPEPVIQSCQAKARYYPEVAEVLASLNDEYELIVTSATPLELLNYLLHEVGHYFAHIFSSISHYKQLKSADFYLGICRELKLQPSELVHVGDNWQFDFLIPRQVGIRAFHLDRAGNSHQESLADLTQLKFHLLD
jgi:putative hydrolase of the HAD superfamily